MRTHGARGHRRIVVTVPDGEDAEVVAVGAKQAQRLADHGVETSWGGQCRYLVLRRRPGRGA